MKRISFLRPALLFFAVPVLACAFTAVRAQTTTGDQLASTCRSEANIEADDPRYGVGYCMSFLQHALSVLRNKGTCDGSINANKVESEAMKAFISGVQNHPDLGGEDAETAAESILGNYFGCNKHSE